MCIKITMSTTRKPAPTTGSHMRPVRVAPMVTDPAMRSNKGPAEALLNDELGGSADDDSDRDAIFSRSSKTKEELSSKSEDTNESGETNTLLIIVFALIVIALVAIIVWMLVKQNNDKTDEEELKRIIVPQSHPLPQPHPRNGLPPNPSGMPARLSPEQQQHMAAVQRQQMNMQRHMAKMHTDLTKNAKGKGKGNEDNDDDDADNDDTDNDADNTDGNEDGEAEAPAKTSTKASEKKQPTKAPSKAPTKKQPVTFADVMAAKSGRPNTELRQPLLDEEPVSKPVYSTKNPHPSILRAKKPADSTDEVDDILRQVENKLSSKPTSEEDMDRKLLDKVAESRDATDSDGDDDADVSADAEINLDD